MADEAEGENVWSFKLTLVRHGETSENRNKIIQGQRDTVLNEEGKEQVKLVSKRLKDENFTKVFSSDLQRALKTAEGICTCNTFCGDLQICEEPLLRERNYAQVEGQPCAELKKLAQLGKIPNGAETHEQLDKRAVIFFRNLLEELYQSKKEQNDAEEITINQAISCQCDNRQITRDVDKHVVEHNHTRDKDMSENVLVVSHGGWIRSLIKYFAKDLPSQFPLARSLLTRQISPNTGITSFKLTVNGTEVNSIECLKLYDKSHLT